MNKKAKLTMLLVSIAALALVATIYLRSHNTSVLNPKGTIAGKESHLILVSTLLMLIIVVPVYIMTFGIAWKYRASNKKAKYTPNWDHNRLIEGSWWAIPGIIILVLSVITWRSSHALDPFKPLSSSVKPITIQVVALQWKWLFIYPEQNIASVNFVQFPIKTPVDFQITADAPMNSFWIPQLGGQIYAMSGMSTQLHLDADETGTYEGSSANISGEGFSSMRFTAKASTSADFFKWLTIAQTSSNILSQDKYDKLSEPATDNFDANKPYSSVEPELFDMVLMKYLDPSYKPPARPQTHEHSGVY